MNNNTIINNLSESLILSSKMQKSFAITSDHISPIPFTVWTSTIKKLHAEAYKLVTLAHNDDLSKMDTTINKDSLYEAIREVLALIGKVNNRKLNCNESMAIMICAEATKTVNIFHGEALTVKSQLTNVRKQLKDIDDVSEGINKEYRENLIKREAELSDKLNNLKTLPDMVTVERTRVSDKVFRAAVEHYLGDVITSQKMKTWDELEEERKAKNKKSNTHKKEIKKAENK